MRPIQFLVVHCSDSPNGQPFTAEDIHNWHQQRGWDGIGYNAVGLVGGGIEPGRPDYWQGAHVRDFDEDGQGDNSDSLGYCLIGRDQFDDAQLRDLEGWLIAKQAEHPQAQVKGHRNLDSRKTCPNFDVQAWWAERKKKHIG